MILTLVGLILSFLGSVLLV